MEELEEVDLLWSGGNKLLICLSARMSISSPHAPHAFCQECKNLWGQINMLARSWSCQGTWLGCCWRCCSPSEAGTAGNTQSYCLLAVALPPCTTSGEGHSSPSAHHTVTPGSLPTSFNRIRAQHRKKQKTIALTV